MKSDDRRKPLSQGAENPHGQVGHPVCHNCGWTFPNPHPSAKQRRAHRRHCGTIEGFPLLSPHGGGDDAAAGSNGNDDDDNAAAPGIPVAAASVGGEGGFSDAHPHQQAKPAGASGGAAERPAMEEGNVGTVCGTEEGKKTSGSIRFHGDEAPVGIHQGNTKDSPEATSAPGGDKELKVPALPCDKEIQKVAAVNVVEKLENRKQLEGLRLAVELTDDAGDSNSFLAITAPPDCSVNEMCAEVDQGVLDKSSVETEPVADETSRGGNSVCLESSLIEATESNDSMDNFFEINVLSNLNTSSSKETGAPGTDMALNLKEVSSESYHTQEMNTDEVGKQELGCAPLLLKVSTADHQGTSPEPDKGTFPDTDKDNDVFDSHMREKEDNYVLSTSQMPHDGHEDNILDMKNEICPCHEQVELDILSLPASHEADPELRGMQSESISIESRKVDVSEVNHEVCKYQGQAGPDTTPDTVVPVAELKSEICTIDPRLAKIHSEKATIEPSENYISLLSSGWAHGNSLEVMGKRSELVGKKSDENENRTDGINEVEYHSFKEHESGLSIEDVRGTGGSASGEVIAFPVTVKDQPLGNLIRVVEGSVTPSDHVEQDGECSSRDKLSFPDLVDHLTSEGMTIDDGSTCCVSKLLSQVNERTIDGCIAVTEDYENDHNDPVFHHEAPKEIINSESVVDIFYLRSLHYQDLGLGENKMKRNQEITDSIAVSDGGSQPCPPTDVGSEKEVEFDPSQIATEPRSCITEGKQHSDMDLVKNELEREPELTHVSPISESSKSIIDDRPSNMESMSSMSSMNLHQESSQNEVRESSTESADDVDHDSVVAETHIHIKPNETPDTVSEEPDQEGILNQSSEVHVSHQSVETPTTEDIDMVTPPDMLSGIQNSEPDALNRNGEIASRIGLESEEQADFGGVKDGARYPQKVLEETIDPESTSDIYVKSLQYHPLRENKVQRNYELSESVAASSESFQPFQCMDMGSESHGSIPLEAWIDYSHSNLKGVESGQSIMHLQTEPRSCITEEHHPNTDLGKNELGKEPELIHMSPTSGTSRLIIDDTFSNLESMSSMSSLNLRQAVIKNDGDQSVVGETHFRMKPSETRSTFSEKSDEQMNNEVQLSLPTEEISTTGNMISPPDRLSGIQSSTSLEELNRNGKIVSNICHESDKSTDNVTLNKDIPVSSARYALVDTISQTDSTEVHWGSVSALSANDAIDSLQEFDAEALPDANIQRSGGLHELCSVQIAASEEPGAEISYLSEAPTVALADGNQVSTKIGTQQSSSCTTSNDVSPHTQVVCESQGRKKREEIIAKVESWSSGKQQHIPLKTLLVEANKESKQKTANASHHKLPLRSNRSHAEGFTTGTPAPNSEHLTETYAKKEVQKEWNSPARLPTNRNDKRKVKGKPQWVPFLCCPSLN